MPSELIVQYLPYAVIAVIVVLLIFGVRAWDREETANCAKLNSLSDSLHEEILEASMLVAKSCPDNQEAHQAVIEAAKHLVYPDMSDDGIVPFHLVEKRYQKGFEFAAKARKLAVGDSQ